MQFARQVEPRSRCDRQGRITRNLRLECGSCVRDVEIAYELVGPMRGPLYVVLGGISAYRAPSDCLGSGWWAELVGPGRAIDTDRVRVLGIDYVGGPDGSTGMADIWGQVGDQSYLTTYDQARAINAVLQSLGEIRVDAWVGCSFGGMVGFAFSALFPARIGALIAVSAAHRSSPQAMALRWVQQSIARLGRLCGRDTEGLELARALAMTTYRTQKELNQRFAHDQAAQARAEVTGYLSHCGSRFASRFDGPSFIALSDAIDRHDIPLQQVDAPLHLIAIREDQVVPVEQLRGVAAQAVAPATIYELSSDYGHDAFLKQAKALDRILRNILCPGPCPVLKGIKIRRYR